MPMGDAVVRLEAVRFRWPGAARDVLAIEAFSLAPGELLFLRGPSGCGKSTLLGLLAGVLEGAQGRVAVCGALLGALGRRARDRHRAANIGIIFQLFNLLPFLSARDNIALPLRFAPARLARAGGADGLAAHIDALAEALDLDRATLAAPAGQLSIGQQQRVAAARALIGAPPLLLADEPTSALDADRQARFLALLQAQCRAHGSALLFVSHDDRLAGAFDRVLDWSALSPPPGGGEGAASGDRGVACG